MLGTPSSTYSNKILCFGEMMLRLTPVDHERLEQTDALQLYFDGAEAMCAMSLARQGDHAAYMTYITDNRIGNRAIMELSACGVDTSRSVRKPGRMGLFYFERGRSMRSSVITYDRLNTPISRIKRADFNWDSILNGVETFFFSGIAPAISEDLHYALLDALIACKGRGIKTIVDLNMRTSMWSLEIARRTWREYLPYVDLCIGSDEDIWRLFPHANVMPNRHTTLQHLDYYEEVARNLCSSYGCSAVAIQIRAAAASGLGKWRALFHRNNETVLSGIREIQNNEPAGCGDAFAAAIIHGVLHSWESSLVANYALAASALKSTIEGSVNYATEAEILHIMSEDVPVIDY